MSGKKQLYFGGHVHTVDEALPKAEAVAVADGKIVAVGNESECRDALGGDYDSIDIGGKTILPGFIDTHLHPAFLVYFETNADLTGVKNFDEMNERIIKSASDKPDVWAVGLRFDEQDMDEPALPTRGVLDDAFPDRPAIVIKHDGHMVIANTKAIEAAGIDASTPDPDGGVIDRENSGHPAGPFRELAARLILGAMPMPDVGELLEGAKATFKKLASHGITSIGAVLQTGAEGPAGESGAFDVIFMTMVLEHARCNIYGLLIAEGLDSFEAARKTGLHSDGPGGNKIGSIKIFSDGTFGSCSALMYEPYTDQPDKTGFLVHPEDEIYGLMEMAHNEGLQITIHAIGDAANRKCVDLYDRLLKEYPREDHRHRIEHASILDEGTIADMARLGIVVSTQPMFIHSEKHWLHKRLGPERAKITYPLRSLLNAGVKIAGASDAPVESTEVLHAIECCVTREGFETGQSITAEEAIRMFTIDAAFAQFEESVKGSITPGKRADMVVLNKNPLEVPPDQIKNIDVEMTIVGGEVVYRRGE